MKRSLVAGGLLLLSCDSGDAMGSSGSSGAVASSSSSSATSSDEGSASSTSGGGSMGATVDDTMGASTSASSSESSGGSAPPTRECPAPPASLTSWLVGNDADADVDPTGPGLILMGGGPDVDEAFQAAFPYTAGGDVVVLRASGSDGYNDYFLEDIGGVDSVETLLIDQEALAEDPYVACRVEQAELVWFAGGDQAEYMRAFADSPVAEAIDALHTRGGVIGGTSAGLAILGEHVFAAYEGTVYPDEVLEDPYNPYMTLDAGPFSVPPLARVITDSHFYERDRMGRLIGFLSRLLQDGTADTALGLGVDEGTALVIGPGGEGTVYGDGYVYVLEAAETPEVCAPKLPLTHSGLSIWRLIAGDTVTLQPSVDASIDPGIVGAEEGVVVPGNPY